MAHRRKSLGRKNNIKRTTMKRGGASSSSKKRHRSPSHSNESSANSRKIDALTAQLKRDTEETYKNFINEFMKKLPNTIQQLDEGDIPSKYNNGVVWFPPSGNGQVYISDKKVVKIINIGSQIHKVGIDPQKTVSLLNSELKYYHETTKICPNSFCKLIGYYYNPYYLILKIVMENCGENLEVVYKSISNDNRLQKVKTHIKDIVDAVKCLHTKGFAHRDIKPRNLVLTSSNNSSEKVTFVDAGTLCKQTDETIYSGGTPFYHAPELVGQDYTIDKSTDLFATDVFALGVTFLFMIMPPDGLKNYLFPTAYGSTFSDNYKGLRTSYKNTIKTHLEFVFGVNIQLEHFFGEPNQRLRLKDTTFSL